jgi:hypothetical protein
MLWTHLRRPWRRISPRRNSGHRGGPSSARRSHRLRRRIVVGLRARCSMVAVGKESSTIAMASANLLPRPGWVAVIDRLATSFSRGAGADASLLHASHVRWPPGTSEKRAAKSGFNRPAGTENLLVSTVFPAPRCWATIKRPAGTHPRGVPAVQARGAGRVFRGPFTALSA